MLTPPRDGRGYWWAAVALFVLAAAFLVLAVILLFTGPYAFGAGPDGSDIDCRAIAVAIVWGDGIEQVPDGYEDACHSSAVEDIWTGVGAAALAVAFAAGGLLCRRAIRRTPLRAMGETSATGGQALSLPLGHGWGPARAELTSEALTLVMPAILRRRWTIPMAEITVVDPDGVEDAMAEDVVPATPLTLPRFYVAPTFPRRELALLFRRPRRVPPFRIWALGTGVSPRQTRSAAGLWADGVVLSFRQRPAVVTAFVRAGARLNPSEAAWAQAHHVPVADAAERRRILRTDKWVGRSILVVVLLLGIGLRSLLTDVASSDWGLALLVGIIALTLAIVYLPRLLRRR